MAIRRRLSRRWISRPKENGIAEKRRGKDGGLGMIDAWIAHYIETKEAAQ